MQSYGDNFIIVLPAFDGDILHTAAHPFCFDDKCPCHEDPELLAEVDTLYQNGLITPEEATRIVKGDACE